MKETIIVAVLLILIIGLAAIYIIREKKKGTKCIGCPNAKECASGKGGCCGNNKE